jgi:hypothetical protein
LSSFFSSAAKTAEVNNTANKIENFILTNGINALPCRAKSRHPVTAPLDNSAGFFRSGALRSE